MSDYTLLIGDALEQLRTLPSDSVSMCCTSPPYFGLRSYLDNGHPDKHLEIGIEAHPDEFVARLVEVFREVKRVLHSSGVLFLNLGDSYHGGGGGNYGDSKSTRTHNQHLTNVSNRVHFEGIKPKDLIGIPWLCAFALRADGWYLRSAITWCKGNPMPESVQDRPTSATEMVFMLAKNERYFYDADAIREPYNQNSLGRYKYQFGNGAAAAVAKSPAVGNGNGHNADPNPMGRNRRNWWLVNSEPYPGSHFAVMPTKLVEPCILAGTSAHGCCSACGAPWERVVEREVIRQGNTDCALNGVPQPAGIRHGLGKSTIRSEVASTTLGWAATCTCSAPVQPCVVLDPFAGSGTTLATALKFGRSAIGIDLDPRNALLAEERIRTTQPLLFSL